MNWELTYRNETKTFAEWGISQATRSLKNCATDILTVQVDGDAISAPLQFLPNERIAVFYDGKCRFRGIVTKTPSYGNPRKEYQQYTFSGPWWYFENIIYQQTWKEAISPDDDESLLQNIQKSRLILGQNIAGNAITIGEQITEIVNYINGLFPSPIVFLGDDLDLPVYIPLDECKDLSCADVIKKLLRWVPDAIVFFDYTSSVPRLHILRYQQLSLKAINVSELSEFHIMPRYDLQVPAVVLKFEKTHRSDGKTWETTDIQKYPISATGLEPQALVMTISLEGTEATYIKQNVETEMIQMQSETWWRKHLPGLQNVRNFVVESPLRSGNLANELLSGNIADWMRCSTEKDTITAKISYETDDEIVVQRDVAVKINTTDAQTKTYRNLVSFTESESVPVGLAEYIYQGVSILPYEGQCILVQTEVSENYMGCTVNLFGGRKEWETMKAVVQSVEESIATGKIQITLGPAKHLGPDDLTELTKSNRRRVQSRRLRTRSTGEAGGNAYVEQGRFGHAENSAYGPGRWTKLSFYDPQNTSRKILLDTSELATDVTVCLREKDVSDSGVLKKRYTLSSEPFTDISNAL